MRDNLRRFVITQDTSFTAIFVSRESVESSDSTGAGLQLLPNPAKGKVEVLCGSRMVRVEIIDAQGRQVLEQPTDGTSASLDISRLSEGLYTVIAHTVVGTSSRRLVVK